MSHESSKPLKDVIKEKAQGEVLSDNELARLMSMQSVELVKKESVSSFEFSENQRETVDLKLPGRTLRWASGLAAICVLAILLSTFNFNQGTSNNDFSIEIAEEVVKNHLKLKPLDVHSDNMIGIREFFTLLDFRPSTSTKFNVESNLLGGRYCSIQGVTAAQLRFEQNDGLSTLYQAPYSKKDFGPIPKIEQGQSPLYVVTKGVPVTMWVENGLLMVLVGR